MTLITDPDLAIEPGPRLTDEQRAADLAAAEAMYAEQQIISAEVAAAFALLWASADPSLEPTLFLAGLAAIVDEFAAASRSLAASQVNDFRVIAGLRPLPDLPEIAEALDITNRTRTPGQLVQSDATFQVLRRVDRRRPTTERDRSLAYAGGEHAAQKRALDAGRHVVTDLAEDRWLARETDELPFDREIIGWYRVTDGDPCHFCAMLASRGAVYSSRFTAGVSIHDNVNLDGGYNAAWHPNCNCVAKPLYSTDLDVPDLNRELRDLWNEVTAGLSGSNARSAYRRAIQARSQRLAEESQQ